MKSIKLFLSFILVGLFFVAKSSFALPFDISPLFLPTTVVPGEETFAYYTVTNSTTKASPGSFVKFTPPNVRQAINTLNSNLCSATFDLAPGGSCTLKLVITGAVDADDPDPLHHLFVCRQGGKTCAGPGAQLNVSSITLLSLAVQPITASIPVGTKQKFIAIGTFSDGSSRTIRLVNWNTSDASVATIDNLGVATGVTVGVTSITANSGAITSPPATLTVSPATLVSVSVTPDDASIPAGTELQYIAIGTFSDNSTHDITQLVNWISSAPATATIIPSGQNAGLATGVAAGGTIITALDLLTLTSDTVPLTVTANALLSISIVPQTVTIGITDMQQFTAIGSFTGGLTEDITDSVTWSSSDPSVATINSIVGAGIATGVEVGNTTITAALDGKTAIAALTVQPVVILPVFAGTSSGRVCVSTNNGLSWPASGCVAPAGGSPIRAMAANSGHVYAGTDTGSVCTSTNIGVSWSCLTLGPGGPITALAADVFQVYAGKNNGDVCVSVNNGTSFPTCASVNAANPVTAVAADPDLLHVYAATSGVNDICVSSNNGTTWGGCQPSPDTTPVLSLATETGYVYAGTTGLLGAGLVCVSTDQGETWPVAACANLANGPVTAIAVNDDRVYAGTNNGFVCVSYNHGFTFPTCTHVDNLGVLTIVLSVAAEQKHIYAGSQLGEVCVSTDDGTTWPSNRCMPVITPAALIRALVVKVN